MLTTLRPLMIIILCTLLFGCGFHLRGVTPLPEDVKSLKISASPSDIAFTKILIRQLQVNGVVVRRDYEEADVTISITSHTTSNQMISTTGSAQAGQYLLTENLNFKVSSPHGATLIPETHIQTSRTYNSNATQVLSSDKTVGRLQDEMYNELALEILRRLSKVKVSPP